MAKSKLSWSLDESKLTVEVLEIAKKITFDMVELFPDFPKYDDVQQKTIANGTKQKLADHLARTKDMALTPTEMVTELNALWKRLTVERLWGSGKTGRVAKLDTAWNNASEAERAVLAKLGLKPKNVE